MFSWYNVYMFTGIVEEIGTIKKLSGSSLTVQCQNVLQGTKIGDSIAIDGCCQTVTQMTSDSFTVNVSKETFKVTNFKNLQIGTLVNLERALTPTSRMGGHIVQGHIDMTAKYLGDMKFEVPDNKYIIYKGSITVNGVSLTVAEINDNIFAVAIIPHTLENTNLKNLKIGDIVNIETDIVGRYIEKFLSTKNNKIDENFLLENGFM